jgi:hypothetical protein
MQEFFNVFIDFVRQAIGAIFRFVAAVWSWAAEQMARVLSTPWHDWPIWRVILLAVLIYGLGWYLWKSLVELWDALKKTLAALATMMGVLIKTLPQIVLAGLIALGGVWLLSNLDLSDVRPSFMRPSFMHTGGEGERCAEPGPPLTGCPDPR